MQSTTPTATQHPWSQHSHWAPHLWHHSPSPVHTARSASPSIRAGEKRKHSQSDDASSSSSSSSSSFSLSGLDALRKRQRRCRSHSSLSDSDDNDFDDSPKTPMSSILDDSMDWAADPQSSNPAALTALLPNQSSIRPPSPSQAIHRLQLLREARPPSIATHAASFAASPYAREPPPSKVLPMNLTVTDSDYIFTVELPGYNIDGITVSCKKGNVVSVVADIWHLPRECCHQWDITFDSDVNTALLRATMDRSSNLLTLVARRFRRFVPIEYQVEKKPPSPPHWDDNNYRML